MTLFAQTLNGRDESDGVKCELAAKTNKQKKINKK
jgi:hypothetical protein